MENEIIKDCDNVALEYKLKVCSFTEAYMYHSSSMSYGGCVLHVTMYGSDFDVIGNQIDMGSIFAVLSYFPLNSFARH